MTDKIISRLRRFKNSLRKTMSSREFFIIAVSISLGAGLIGFALKFTTYFDNWYWLPAWPNAFDSLFLITTGILLFIFGIERLARA